MYRFYIFLLAVTLFMYLLCEWSNYHTRRYPHHVKQGMNECVIEAAKLSTHAKSSQNDFLATIQNAQAAAMMKTLRMLVPEEDINALTLIQFNEVNKEIRDQEMVSTRKLLNICPSLIPTNSRLANLAGLHPNIPSEDNMVESL